MKYSVRFAYVLVFTPLIADYTGYDNVIDCTTACDSIAVGNSDSTLIDGDIDSSSGLSALSIEENAAYVTLDGELTSDRDTASFTAVNIMSSISNAIVTINEQINVSGAVDDLFGLNVSELGQNNTVTVNSDILLESTHSTGNVTAINMGMNANENDIIFNGNLTVKGNRPTGIGGHNSDNNQVIINGSLNINSTGVTAYGIDLFHNVFNSFSITEDLNISNNGTQNNIGLQLNGAYNNEFYIGGNINIAAEGYAILLVDSGSNAFTIGGNIIAPTGIHLGPEAGGNIFNINGNILASTTSGHAINSNATDTISNVFNYNGGRIVGEVILGANDVFNINIRPSLSYIFEGDTNGATLVDANKPVVNGSIASMGLAALNDEGNQIRELFTQISQPLLSNQRELSSTKASKGLWFNAYDIYTASEDDQLLRESIGLTAGYSMFKDSPVGLFINAESNKSGYGLYNADEVVERKSLVSGLVVPKFIDSGDGVSLRVLAGQSFHDVSRLALSNMSATGYEVVKGEYITSYLGIGGDWANHFTAKHITVDIAAGGEVVRSMISGYRSDNYFQVRYRDLNQFHGHVQTGVAYQSLSKVGSRGRLRGYVDLGYRHAFGGDNVVYFVKNVEVEHEVDADHGTFYEYGIDADFMSDVTKVSGSIVYRGADQNGNHAHIGGWGVHAGVTRTVN